MILLLRLLLSSLLSVLLSYRRIGGEQPDLEFALAARLLQIVAESRVRHYKGTNKPPDSRPSDDSLELDWRRLANLALRYDCAPRSADELRRRVSWKRKRGGTSSPGWWRWRLWLQARRMCLPGKLRLVLPRREVKHRALREGTHFGGPAPATYMVGSTTFPAQVRMTAIPRTIMSW